MEIETFLQTLYDTIAKRCACSLSRNQVVNKLLEHVQVSQNYENQPRLGSGEASTSRPSHSKENMLQQHLIFCSIVKDSCNMLQGNGTASRLKCPVLLSIMDGMIEPRIFNYLMEHITNEDKYLRFISRQALVALFLFSASLSKTKEVTATGQTISSWERTFRKALERAIEGCAHFLDLLSGILSCCHQQDHVLIPEKSQKMVCQKPVSVEIAEGKNKLKEVCCSLLLNFQDQIFSKVMPKNPVKTESIMPSLQFIEAVVLWTQKEQQCYPVLKHFHKTGLVPYLLETALISPVVCNQTLKILYESLSHDFFISTLMKVAPLEMRETCKTVMHAVKDGNWLVKLPFRTSFCGFGGTRQMDFHQTSSKGEADSNFPHGDFVLLRRTTGLILKAINVAAFSNDDGIPDMGKETLALLKEWLQQSFQACSYPGPQKPLLICLFVEQDDLFIDAMLSCLELYLKRICTEDTNPHMQFIFLLHVIHYDYQTLLDFLISNETCMLLYMVHYLKLMLQEWNTFEKAYDNVCSCSDDNEEEAESLTSNAALLDAAPMHVSVMCRTLDVLTNLEKAIRRLVVNDLFPYNPKALVLLLQRCREKYTDSYNSHYKSCSVFK